MSAVQCSSMMVRISEGNLVYTRVELECERCTVFKPDGACQGLSFILV